MSFWREHVVDKYFSYRRRYVAAIAERAPHRRSLAVLSEVVRLAFACAGSALCAAILWALVAGAAQRPGALGWTLVFAALAAGATAFGLIAAHGCRCALTDRCSTPERGDVR